MPIQMSPQKHDYFECSLLDHRLRPRPTIPLDDASTDAATRSARAMLQLAQATHEELVGFELRRNGVRVLTSLENLQNPPTDTALVAGDGLRGHCMLF